MINERVRRTASMKRYANRCHHRSRNADFCALAREELSVRQRARRTCWCPGQLREAGSVRGGGHPVEESGGFLSLCTKTPHGWRSEDISTSERRRR